MKIHKTVVFFAAVFYAAVGAAADFETDSAPGEGIPNFSTRNSNLILHSQPVTGSNQVILKPGKNRKILYDTTRQITRKSVMLTAKTDITDLICTDTAGSSKAKPVISRGESIEYLQYRAEGYITARYSGRICEVNIAEGKTTKFDGLGKGPIVEWWIRVVDAKKKPLGWLLVDKSQVNFLKRTF